jgi:hypothetical protein
MMKEEIPSRRDVLRGVLAVGCSLLIPAALFGCNAKQGGSSTSTEPISPAAGTAPDASATPGKMTQASVKYQAQPKDGQQCAGCMHFIAGTNTCELVDGQISAEGWCSLWAKKP